MQNYSITITVMTVCWFFTIQKLLCNANPPLNVLGKYLEIIKLYNGFSISINIDSIMYYQLYKTIGESKYCNTFVFISDLC